jgi:hypothetical protein
MCVQCGIRRYESDTKTILIVVIALHIQRLCSVCFLTTTHILTGAKKHEAAMKEMARRKNENSRKPAKLGVGAAAHNKVVLPARGMAAGVKNKNKHLQEFENLKTSYRKKKGECWFAVLNVAGSCGPRIGSANGVFRVIISALQTCLVCRAEFLPLLSFPRCLSCFRVLYSPRVHLLSTTEAKERKMLAPDSNAVGKRFVSQTAPAYDNKNHPQYRMPATKVGGTVTRRTDQPTRRGAGNYSTLEVFVLLVMCQCCF